jgi:hypothetical protein
MERIAVDCFKAFYKFNVTYVPGLPLTIFLPFTITDISCVAQDGIRILIFELIGLSPFTDNSFSLIRYPESNAKYYRHPSGTGLLLVRVKSTNQKLFNLSSKGSTGFPAFK